MKNAVRWYDYITVNIYYLGLATLIQTSGLLFPILVQNFVGEQVQGTYFGRLRLATLMIAVLVQGIAGNISDLSTHKWGKRRPFILTGTLFDIIIITSIGLTFALTGANGFWSLFFVAILLQISTNSAQAAQQGLIPDLVPESLRGKFSGVKALFEIPLPLLLVSFTVAKWISLDEFWAALIFTSAVLIFTMAITMFVPERRNTDQLINELDWSPILRIILMTLLFTGIILILGEAIKQIGKALTTFNSFSYNLSLMGMSGFTAMVIAIGLGVWFSIRIALGEEASRNSSFNWWVINRLAFLAGINNLATFALFYIQARLGYHKETAAQPAAILLLLVGVFILITALPSGWLTDRYGHKKLVAISGLLAFCGTMTTVVSSNLILIYIGGCVIGIATGIFYTANWALGTKVIPKYEAGRYLGIANLAGAGAGAVGAYIGGPIADFFTIKFPGIPGLGYVLLFILFGSLFLFSIFALRQIQSV